MRPIDDPRPLAEVLRDWLKRHELTAYAAAGKLDATQATIRRWVRGAPCTHDKALRALMTIIDAEALDPAPPS